MAKNRKRRVHAVKVASATVNLLKPYLPRKEEENMTNNNRDQMHAAGGAFLSGQLAREAGNVAASITDTPVPPRAKRIVTNTLTQAENYKLVQWLHNRTPVWGEGAPEVAKEAAEVLGIEKINREHIRNRWTEHADTLPKAVPPVAPNTPEARIAALENVVATLARCLVCGTGLTEAEVTLLADFYNKKA